MERLARLLSPLILPALLPLMVAGCFVDMSEAYDLAEAKAAFDAAPSISASEYEAAIARQDIRLGGPTPPTIQQPSGAAPDAIDLPQQAPAVALGQGPVRARLALGQGCAGLPPIGQGQVLIVAAFADALPESDLIFATRLYQADLAACIEAAGGRPKFQTRIGVSGLDAASEILIYTS